MGNFPYQCHKILPLVFDDSLSYYEVLCKLRDTINAIIEAGETGLTPWGEIQGDIEDQEDLQTEFATKQNKLTVNPATTTGTLTGLTIDGVSYNIPGTSSGATWGSITGTLSNQTDLKAALDALNVLIAEKAEVAANTAAAPTHHLNSITVDGVTYDIQSTLPIASSTSLGGVKAETKTSSDTVEVKIGSDGKLYVPAAATGQSVAGVTVVGTSVVDTSDNTAKIPVATTGVYGAVMVGDGLVNDSTGANTTLNVDIADETDIDDETENKIIDAANVRYAAVEAMKDTSMSAEDKTAIKSNLEIGTSAITDVKVVSSSVVSGGVATIPLASTGVDGVVRGQSKTTAQTEEVGLSSGRIFTKPIQTLVVGQAAIPGVDTIYAIQLDGVDYNLPSGGSGSYTPGYGITIQDSVISAKAKTNGGVSVDSDGISADLDVVQGKLIAGTGIEITDNTISVTGGGSLTAGNGIDITDNAISAKAKTNGGVTVDSDGISADLSIVQKKLTPVSNITIDSAGNISATDTTYEGSNTITVSSGVISVKKNSDNGGLTENSAGLGVNFNRVQEKLTAGTGIDITGTTIKAEGVEASINGSTGELKFAVVASDPGTYTANTIYFILA